jgi:hypothetical protein
MLQVTFDTFDARAERWQRRGRQTKSGSTVARMQLGEPASGFVEGVRLLAECESYLPRSVARIAIET